MWSGSVSCSCTIRSRTHLFRYALASAKSIGAKRIESARGPHVWHQDFPLRQSARYLAITGVSAQNHTSSLILVGNVSQNGIAGSDSQAWVMLRIGRSAVQSHKRKEPVNEESKVCRFGCPCRDDCDSDSGAGRRGKVAGCNTEP